MITTTTLAYAATSNDAVIVLADPSLVVIGTLIACGGEFMQATELLGVATRVQRGVNGTHASVHAASAAVQYGPAGDFLAGSYVPVFGTLGEVFTAGGPSAAAAYAPSGGGNPFDQDLNTTNSPSFVGETINGQLGPEIVVDPSFATPADWTQGAGWVVSGGAATATPGSASDLTPNPQITTVIATLYHVVVVTTSASAGAASVVVGGTTVDLDGTAGGGTVTADVYAADTTGLVLSKDVDYDGVIASISIKRLDNLLTLRPDPATGLYPMVINGRGHQFFGVNPAFYPALEDSGTGWATSLPGLGVVAVVPLGDTGIGMTLANAAATSFWTWGISADGTYQLYGYVPSSNVLTFDKDTGAATFLSSIASTPVAVADLNPSPTAGMIQTVNDALAPIIGATVSAGGAAFAQVCYNGTDWKVTCI